MTDRELQNALDRLVRGDDTTTPPTDHEDAADWKAYRLLYTALEDEPEGSLPDNFAQQVVDRVMPADALDAVTERLPWLEWMLPPVVLAAAFIVTLLLMPAVARAGSEAIQLLVDPLSWLWTEFRLDIVLSACAALLIASFLDRFVLRAWLRKGLAAT